MDKNELIKRLKEKESTHQVDDYFEGFDDGIAVALGLAEQLEEPETLDEKWIFDNQEMYIVNDTSENAVNVWRLKNMVVPESEKPVVPQFVADWLEKEKKKSDDLLWSMWSREVDFDYGMWGWLFKNNSQEEVDNRELLTKAWVNGYTVEKEQKYYVKEPTTGQFLIKDNQQSSGVKWVDGFSSNPESYTEKEIKDITDRFWSFALPVEEEEE